MKTTTTWKLSNGKAADVTVELRTERTINADGDVMVVPCCELTVLGHVEGIGLMGEGVVRLPAPQMVGAVQIVGSCGRLGIPEAQMVEIEGAIAAAKASPEWRAHEANAARIEREGREYDRHTAKMRRVMGY